MVRALSQPADPSKTTFFETASCWPPGSDTLVATSWRTVSYFISQRSDWRSRTAGKPILKPLCIGFLCALLRHPVISVRTLDFGVRRLVAALRSGVRRLVAALRFWSPKAETGLRSPHPKLPKRRQDSALHTQHKNGSQPLHSPSCANSVPKYIVSSGSSQLLARLPLRLLGTSCAAPATAHFRVIGVPFWHPCAKPIRPVANLPFNLANQTQPGVGRTKGGGTADFANIADGKRTNIETLP